jgi:hypothetical protein
LAVAAVKTVGRARPETVRSSNPAPSLSLRVRPETCLRPSSAPRFRVPLLMPIALLVGGSSKGQMVVPALCGWEFIQSVQAGTADRRRYRGARAERMSCHGSWNGLGVLLLSSPPLSELMCTTAEAAFPCARRLFRWLTVCASRIIRTQYSRRAPGSIARCFPTIHCVHLL